MKFLLNWKWELLSPLCGVLLTLSFAPFNLWLLSLAALAFVFFSWQDVSPRRALLRGFLFGAGLYGSGVFWVYVSIHDYGGAHYLGAGLLTAFFCLFWTIFPALTAYLTARLGKGRSVPAKALLLPAIWVLIDYFRGYLLLNGFPWLQVGYTQLDSPLAGYVPLVGGYGTEFVLLLSTLLIAETFKRRASWRKTAVVLLALWGAGFGLNWIEWTDAAAKPLKVTLIQGNVAQDKKWLPEYRIKTLISYQQLTEQHWDSDVVVWPETAIPAFLHQVEDFYIQPLQQKARGHGTDLIVSLPAKGKSGKETYNMVLTLGKQRGEYKKNHLLPFGEYLPLQPLSGFVLELLGVNLGNFEPGGDHQPLMRAGGYPFAASICYEDAFSSAFLPALPEAAYLVNVTNDAWFGDTIEPHQHMQIARMRSLETGRYLLRATNTGVSGVVDPKGKIVGQAPLFEQATLTQTIYPMSGMTPYARMGDKILMLVLLIVFAIALLPGYKIDER